MTVREALRIGLAVAICVMTLSGCAGVFGFGHADHPEPLDADTISPQQRAMQYFVKAKVYEAQNNYLGAIVALRSAADIDSTSATIYAQLARNYERIKDYGMAARFARRALVLDPELIELRYRLVNWLETAGERAEAAKELEVLLHYEPDNWPLYSHLARTYMDLGETERLSGLFERLLKSPSTPTHVRVNVAYILSRSGYREQAQTVFTEVLESDPQQEDAWIGMAELALSQGDREKGLNYYRSAAKAIPERSLALYELAQMLVTTTDLDMVLPDDDLAFLYRLGKVLLDLKKPELAAGVFESIVGLKPPTVEPWLHSARYYVSEHEYDKADSILHQAIQTMPDSVQLYLFRGAALERDLRFDEAVQVYESGLERVQDDVKLYQYLGSGYEQLARWDEAVEVYKRGLLHVGEGEATLYVSWGMALGRQHRWQEAISRYRKAVAADSLHSDAYLHWGIALESMRKWEEAIDKLSRASALDPTDTRALFYLGSCLEQASRVLQVEEYFDRASETFARLIEVKPDDAYALNYLGYMYADRGIRLEEAVELLNRAVELEPDNGAFFDSLGWAHYRLGQLEQAEHYLRKALEQIGDHESVEQIDEQAEEQAVIFDHAGDVAQDLGKQQEAAEHWRKALDLSPGNDAVRAKLSAPTSESR